MSEMEHGGEGRTAGRAPPGGRLRVGQIVSSTNGKCSIPSRFETILFKGSRESDAFGRRTHRFNEAEDDLPGPGSYRKSRTLVQQTPSISKKGTGGFASRSKIATDKPRALFLTPGPGSYTAAHAAAETPSVTASAGFPQPAVPSAAFAKPVPRRAVGVKPSAAAVLPGPGEYEVEAPAATTQHHSAVFGSKTARVAAVSKDVPGPGEYEVPAAMQPTPGPSAVFRSSTKAEPRRDPGLGELAKALPQPPHKGPQGFAGTGRDTSPRAAGNTALGDHGELLRGGSASPSDVGDGAAPRGAAKKTKPSSMFATTLLDRFGRPVVRYAPEVADPPGPGQYNVEPPKRRLLISSSWAMSGTERFTPPIKDGSKPPGPAFYTPVQIDKSKSKFHMNSKGSWV